MWKTKFIETGLMVSQLAEGRLFISVSVGG